MRRFLAFASWASLSCTVVLATLHGVYADDAVSPFAAALGGLSLVAALLGFQRHRPPFFVFAASMTSLAGFAVALIAETQSSNPETIEIIHLIALVVVAVGLLRFYQSNAIARRSRVFVDGIIVAMGSWLVTWILLVQPAIENQTSSSLTTVRALVMGTAVVVLFLFALVVFAQATSSTSLIFFACAITSALAGVILREVSFADNVSLSDTQYSLPFLLAAAFTGSAFLHPTSRALTSHRSTRTTTPLMYRFVTITTALIVPVFLLALTDPTDRQDRIIRTASVVLLATAVMIRVIQSVRENSRAQDNLMRNALTDSLTGLPNRILVLEHISSALQQSWMSNKRPTVLFIDVDRFKNINDSLGHSTGDDVLTHVASRLLLAVPQAATVARISGDEFVVLDPTTESPTQSVLLAEKILDSLRNPVPTQGGDMFVTASIGVAYAPKNIDLTADQLLRHADTAMYRAKDAGRNCIALFDDSMLDVVTKRLDVETSLYRALENKELHLVFQPIVDMTLGIVVGFEALMRWNRNNNVVSPAEFIPIAEETGIIVPLGTWALHDALEHLRSWITSGVVSPETTMSVNVSAKQLHDPQFISHVQSALRSASIAPEQLLLEVTESVMITETAQALSAMKTLTSIGVRIAVDDFGTGYSSLSVLQHFPIHSIKIDRTFVHNMTQEQDATTLVRTIVAMANALGSDVIAEGVETADQVKSLMALHCHKAQGYHFSRPISAEEIPQSVATIHHRDTWLDT